MFPLSLILGGLKSILEMQESRKCLKTSFIIIMLSILKENKLQTWGYRKTLCFLHHKSCTEANGNGMTEGGLTWESDSQE